MFRALLISLVMSSLLASEALAGGLVVWMEHGVPDERAVARTSRMTGDAIQLSYRDIVVAPQPLQESDGGRYDALRAVVTSGKSRWQDFEVELPIARELEEVIGAIDVIRDRRDRDDLVNARLFQGAAIAIAFEPDEFLEDERAAPFRKQLPGSRVNRPWLQGMAVDPGRDFIRGDVADGAAYPELKALQERIKGLPDGTVDLSVLPAGLAVVLDGVELHPDIRAPKVRPGLHYAHVLRDGVVAGRVRFDVEPGETVRLPILVDGLELDQARAAVTGRNVAGLPSDVVKALAALLEHRGGPIFLAAMDSGGRPVVVPYTDGASLVQQRPVTVLGSGEMGGIVVASPMFVGSDGAVVTAPGASGGLGFELGVYNAALIGGFDVAFTPTEVVTHSNGDMDANVNTSVLLSPWGGLGGYVLRPVGDRPTLLIAATYGWDAPAHMALGGRLTFGIPVDDGTWLRLTVGGNSSAQPIAKWDEWRAGRDMPMHVVFVRFGLGARF